MVFDKNIYRKILSHAFDIPVSVSYWDKTTENYGEGTPEVKIKFNEEIPVTDFMHEPTLRLAEAYMNDRLDIEGSIQKLVASAFAAKDSFLTNGRLIKYLPKMSHSEKASEADVQKHYDIGNDFYKKWLDPTMTYSCAYFEHPDDTLEQAQRNKIEHILHKLKPVAGKTLLDIGSGWGAMIIAAAKLYGLKTTGITLSQEQFDYTKERIKKEGLEDQVDVWLMDYREVPKDVDFDYVVSVGMFEHVGKENLGLYFQKIKDLLVPDGVALIHGITGQHEGLGVDPFLVKYIFPGGYIPNVSENLTHIMDAKLQIADLEPLRRHYQKTLEIWTENYHKVFDETSEKYGRDFARMWDMYLQASAGSFEAGNIDVMQFLLSNGRSAQTLPMTRSYIYEKEN
ncbi:SAM-dependent methyltransferase [Xylocopilactobacillus apis]|uniref:Cyclopropane-fatty-acyl-phospholipid synthase n=1 Tax=Xylocopilactobacillus apis TaxID=2932183 RepID=A0AAU9CTA4_9LACO|nr:cyclopropane-fatty-acyl-phospholipid synthase family protein [Xylocopilactobacillus apis]BDR57239.1 cyclopropane-fatty-acyl-phospholipid synthase [Xylocopilactobacillus apis]